MYQLRLPSFFLAILFILPFSTLQAEEIISKHVDIHQFSKLISDNMNNPNVEIIDVRTPEEFHAGHISNAVMIDFYAKGFIDKLEKLDKDKTYLLYCRSGNRSGQTLNLMQKLGFKAAYNMKGGMNKWTAENLPVVTP